jgi:Glycosyl hydrolases family 15
VSGIKPKIPWQAVRVKPGTDAAPGRDAAITAIELAAGPLPTPQPLIDYVQFAQICQNEANAIGHFDRASFLINGTPRSWTDQTDGAIPVTDTKLLATAAQLRSQWADPGSTYLYPVNGADQQRGIGPLLGRYPGDVYDGDTDTQAGDHPWAVSTANVAELYYRLAGKIIFGRTVPSDSLSAGFFTQIGVDASTTPAAAAAALQAAGDQMLQAVIFHSDNLELSEQFDATTGYEKSVSNLSWSYASFLSAVRARTAIW